MKTYFGDGRDWFFEKRFGMFVHWGLYAIEGWHEQLQWRRGWTRAQNEALFPQFNPVKFDPDAWLDLAAEAGMEYLVITTKHHDGFCLWDTKQTDFNVMNTPYGKDLIAMLAEACHRRNVPLGFYYSVVDWHQPNYPNQGRDHEIDGPVPGDDPDMDKYMEFLKAQVRELCTQYGEIHCFWWDMNVTGHRDESVNNMIRELQPKAIINGRGFDEGDFATPERDWDHSVKETRNFQNPTEACQSVGIESWGYKEDEDYYSDRYLLQSLDRTLAKGGNYLLNVGPMGDGTIPPESARILRTVGAWYHKVKEAFGDTEPASDLTHNPDVLLTRRNGTIYVHMHNDPSTARIELYPLQQAPKSAVLLNTDEAIETRVDFLPSRHTEKKEYLRLRGLPVNELAGTVLVAKLEFDPPLQIPD